MNFQYSITTATNNRLDMEVAKFQNFRNSELA